MKLTRSAIVSYTIIDGTDILTKGQETARHLWNFTRWCVIGFNRKLHAQRVGKVWDDGWKKGYKLLDGTVSRYTKQSLKGLLPSFPGKFTMQKELKDYWAAKDLSDRCFSYTIGDFHGAMKSWFSNLKNNPRARPPRYASEPRQLTFEVGRNAKPLGDWTYRLTVLGGHIKDRHALVKVRPAPGIKMKDIRLIRIQPDMGGTVVFYQQQADLGGDAMAGIDLGINNIAVIAFQDGTSRLYSGKGILTSDQYYQKRAAKCKPSGWHKGMSQEKCSQREINYLRKSGNKRRLAIHNLTRNIINQCLNHNVGTIIIGDLTFLRNNTDHGKRGNQKLHAWPFAETRRQLTYKAQEVNITVKAVSERNTSKECHICHTVGVRNPRGLLKCIKCSILINSDVNGAFNILNKVSPSPAFAGVGVGATLPGPPSPHKNGQTGKAQFSQIHPTSVAKFDLRNWSIVQDQ